MHSTCAEENTEESNFSEENCIFLSFLELEKKLFETSWRKFKKNCVHLFRRVGWNVIVDFFGRNYVSAHYYGTCPTKFQNPEKNIQTAFPKVYSTFREECFQDKRRFFERNCEVFHQSLTLIRNLFRISCHIYDKVVITEIYLSNWTL